MPKEFDLTVIGAGPAGYVAAIRGTQLGLKVGVVEREHVGGICLNWGCIPTKALLKNAEVYNHFKQAAEFGISCGELTVDFPKVIERSRGVSDRLSKGIQFLLKKNGIDLVMGRAKFVGPNELAISDADGKETERVTSKQILIATGGRPVELPFAKFDTKTVLSSRDAMLLQSPPKSLAIIGAGAIGVEFGYFYNSFGTDVTLIEMLPKIVPNEDEEVSDGLAKAFKKAGIKVMAGTAVQSLKKTKNGVAIAVTNAKGKATTVEAEKVLVAVGIRPNVETLGLEAVGIQTTERGFIQVNENYQTAVDGVFAVGDVVGPPLLAHVGSAEGIHAVEFIVGKQPDPINYNNIPGCTYCQPQVASVGMTEKQAKEQGIEIKVGNFPFRASGKALAMGDTEGFVKMIYDAKYGELLGAHILGAEATEMIAEIGIARTLETTYTEVLKTVHAHPTLSEAIMEATADAFGEAIHI